MLFRTLLFSLFTALSIRFFLVFPSSSPIDRVTPWLKRAGLWFGTVFAAWNFGYAPPLPCCPAAVSPLIFRIAGTTLRGKDAPPTAQWGFPPILTFAAGGRSYGL